MVKAIVDATTSSAPVRPRTSRTTRNPQSTTSRPDVHGQLAAFAALVGTYCLASVLAGFWLAHNNRR